MSGEIDGSLIYQTDLRFVAVRDVPAGVDWRKWKRNSVEQEMTRKYPTASSPTTKAEYAWNLLCQQDRTLDPDGWKYATWDFLDQTILYGSLASMNKAKKLGWTGFVDTEDMFRAQWQKMRELSIAPKVKIVPQAPGKSKI